MHCRKSQTSDARANRYEPHQSGGPCRYRIGRYRIGAECPIIESDETEGAYRIERGELRTYGIDVTNHHDTFATSSIDG